MSKFVCLGAVTCVLLAVAVLAVNGSNDQRIYMPGQLPNARKNESLERNISEIFKIGPDFKLFDNTYPKNKPSGREQIFKVQRNPDGKLALVFNNLTIFQNVNSMTTTTTPYVPESMSQQNKNYSCEEQRRGLPYCTKIDNYLEKSQLHKVSDEEFSKYLSLFNNENQIRPVNISDRFFIDPSSEEFLCTSREEIIYPQLGETRNSGEKIIANDGDKRKQGIQVEKCIFEKGEEETAKCKFAEHFPKGTYNAICRQFYSYRTLVAVVNGKLEQDLFKMPSCCKCVLKRKN